MKTATSPVIRREDYQPPTFHIIATRLTVDLAFNATHISAWHRVRRTVQSDASADLKLDASLTAIQLEKISINGKPIAAEQYRMENDQLIIFDVPPEFELAIENTIQPEKNTALSGLYQSADMLCTQCEAEGFRRITPAIDRPDNLSQYHVTLRADKQTFPLLLCNGNLLDAAEMSGGKHYAVWHDPFPKPTYLFAIVAANLLSLEDQFTTCSGRSVTLRFYAAARDIGRCKHAMASLKRAMAWDEKTYGREYDLDLFNVVAVGDFNMGAMENKSLNLFNTQFVLADSKVSTDADFADVESVIGHEYFHNWSGNRVTCRDWFQLSLKEGFTVFREQQFSADMGSAAVKRIEEVAELRNHQFCEDASPMAHPIRPDSYIEINNFYTATVYNKGAEVIRMLHTLLGSEKFRRGTDLYFARHDGQAVTTDDFVAAMEDASGIDLCHFQHWYCQAGTPVVESHTAHDAERGVFTLTLSQSCPATSGQISKKPFVIPVRVALFDQDGNRLTASVKELGNQSTHHPDQYADAQSNDQLLVLSQPRQTFVFSGLDRKSKPIASLLRGFSAPVELRHSLSAKELAVLLANDDDPFNRWEAGQKLLLTYIFDGIAKIQARNIPLQPTKEKVDMLVQTFAAVLDDAEIAPALQAKILTLPTASYISELLKPIDPVAIHYARQVVSYLLATELRAKLLHRYRQLNHDNDGTFNAEQIGKRSLRDVCLGYLAVLDDAEIQELSTAQLASSRCMTDSVAALTAIANSSNAKREELLNEFYRKWKDEPLVVNKWLRIQANGSTPKTLARVESLTRHEAFELTNPNKVYSLIFGFSHANPFCFHARDASGYRFVRDWVTQLDPINPQVSARLVLAFNNWNQYIPELKKQMQITLQEIEQLPNLSRDVAEIVSKSLDN